MSLLLLLLMILVSSVHCRNVSYRRILHQPLFPESSYPQPDTTSLLLPPPDTSDEPFIPESGTQDQTPPPPPSSPPLPSSRATATAAKTTTKAHHTNPTKKAAITISIGIFVLVILSGFTLFTICRSKRNRPVKERKTEGFNGAPPSRRPDVSSPDVIKHAIIPSIKKTPPPQEAPRLEPEKNVDSVFELKSSLPKRAKFGPRTPPPPDLALLQSITTSQSPPPSSLLAQQVTKPPKVTSTWTNFINKPSSESASDSQFMSNGDQTQGTRSSESASDSLFMSNRDHIQGTKPSETASDSQLMSNGDHTQGKEEPKLKPSESHFMSNGDHTEGTKPKLKPLHWEKVRANSDKATAWDQLLLLWRTEEGGGEEPKEKCGIGAAAAP